MNNIDRLAILLGTRYPIVQAGMVWVSGWRLASAVSNCGGLGLIGAGSMKPELLREHIRKCRSATENSFGINVPLQRKDAESLIRTAIDENIKIIFSSAGNPAKFAGLMKDNSIINIHVVASLKQGLKAEEAGCHAVVGEGVEAGGHNGNDQITLFCLIPRLVQFLKIPVIAAGGITDGKGILSALALGASGVQIGTRFAVTLESSAHTDYKKRICTASEDDTVLILKKIGLIRTLKNNFVSRVLEAELKGASPEVLTDLLGHGRERSGIFEGDLEEGLLEAGQGSGSINEILSVKEVFDKFLLEFHSATDLVSLFKMKV